MNDVLIRIIADGLVIPIILIGAYVLIAKVPRGHRIESYSRILMAGLTAYLIAKLAGTLVTSDIRPFQELGINAGALYLNNGGFPSDHALFVTVITAAVWFETKMYKTAALLTVLTILVCVGRVLAHVHWVADVVFGVIIALVGALWYLTTYQSARTDRKKLDRRAV
ncbi:MAG: Phosphoesterase, PA-phosphatase related protein [Candidatus Saccharibacteria bacterium]|nr:Phosphoesterase, PA-phosphatase related protein [Candidatus Saccharibacteria bacterium]